MSLSNGVLSPQRAKSPQDPTSTPTASPSLNPGSADSSPAKRKRSDAGLNDEKTNGILNKKASPDTTREEALRFQQCLKNSVATLRSHDTNPSILDQPLPHVADDSAERSPKRTKSLEPDGLDTIAARLVSGFYKSLQRVVSDLDYASSKILSADDDATKGSSATRPGNQYTRDLGIISSVATMKRVVTDSVNQQTAQKPTEKSGDDGARTALGNPPRATNTGDFIHATDNATNRAALTIFAGTTQKPQYLFSSFQQYLTPRQAAAASVVDQESQTQDRVVPPLNEERLPNGITATRMLPVRMPETKGLKIPTRTLGEVFSHTAGLPHVMPPRTSKATSTRSSTVNWYDAQEDFASKSDPRGTYTTQPLPAGKWLAYHSSPTSASPSSPDAKRRRRERALSLSEPRHKPSKENAVAQRKAEEEALFRLAYSTFGPTCDNSGAVVSAASRSAMWWERHGLAQMRRFTNSSVNKESLDRDEVMEYPDPGGLEDLDEIAILGWEPVEASNLFESAKYRDLVKKSDAGEQETEEILDEISSMLETLTSFQRNRNTSLTSGSRPKAAQTPSSSALQGTPTEPSSAEVALYETLKAQLTLLVAQVPPFAVAKLNGSQLAELNISTKILVEGQDYTGTMEDEETTAKTKLGAVATPGTNMRTAMANGPYSAHQANHQPPRSAVATPVTASRPPHNLQPFSQQSYSQHQTPSRTLTMNPNQTGSGILQAYQQQRPSSSNTQQRNSPYTPSNFASQATSGSQIQYRQTNPQQYFQRQNQGSFGYSQQSQTLGAPANPALNSAYRQANQLQYAQNARQRQAQPYTQSPYAQGRSGSPQGTPGYSSPHRPAYAAPAQTRPNSYFQNPSSTPQSTSNLIDFKTVMSAEEQATLVEKQRAQIAAQQQNRNAIRNNQAVTATNQTSSASSQPQPSSASQAAQNSHTIVVNGVGPSQPGANGQNNSNITTNQQSASPHPTPEVTTAATAEVQQ
ncbi:MAG: hypothetical protein M1833_004180 [Piccolia ochrophora]|nr:MAG: hypothetical protein M1833_004180 [Piccolia ochrophora]